MLADERLDEIQSAAEVRTIVALSREDVLALVAMARVSDVPSPCVIVREQPFDFGQCSTHDETFPLYGTCRFDGRTSIAEVYAEEAEEQRGRAVAAEMRSAQQ